MPCPITTSVRIQPHPFRSPGAASCDHRPPTPTPREHRAMPYASTRVDTTHDYLESALFPPDFPRCVLTHPHHTRCDLHLDHDALELPAHPGLTTLAYTDQAQTPSR